jgi:hypothetical protein
VTGSGVGAGWQGRADRTSRHHLGRAVDRPWFWWSIGVVFLFNAALSANEHRWAVALLQALTFVWAVVAGVTARYVPPAPPPESAP